jgi:hypothetical protein
MIDKSLLKQLGWSDDLIASVTTMAQSISSGVEGPTAVAGATADASVQSFTSLGYSQTARVSGNGMFIHGARGKS